jgi:chorismate-pyruvate lyase
MAVNSQAAALPTRPDLAECAYPLDSFYAGAGLALPPLQRVDGEEVPPPLKALLVHRNDMTPTLEAFYRSRLELRVLNRYRQGNDYCRAVVLSLEGTNEPIEFGANRICLDRFPAEVQAVILAEREPLGRVLRDYGVVHTCEPNAFFRVASDRFINEALQMSGAQVLYGRHNRLYNPQGQLLSEVVEILRPPAQR